MTKGFPLFGFYCYFVQNWIMTQARELNNSIWFNSVVGNGHSGGWTPEPNQDMVSKKTRVYVEKR